MIVRPSVASVYPAAKPVSAIQHVKPSLEAPLFAGRKKQALAASVAPKIQKPEESAAEASPISPEEAPQPQIAEIQAIEEESVSPKVETPRSEVLEAAQDSFSDNEDVVHINRLKRDELVNASKERKNAELIAIGKRFKAPGRLWLSLENRAKAWSRSAIETTKQITAGITDSVCHTTASALKSTAKAIEGFSSKPPEA